ncbi:MAG: HIT domain-containing protein [Blastocatellia bacterium]|nr:HIT domain-containing protein [Blastocatellia bacterium]
MDFLWSPWRYKYILDEKRLSECPFCVLPQQNEDERHYILHRGEFNFVILNIFPYTGGHLMVVPFEHTASLAEVGKAVSDELMDLTKRCQEILTAEYHPHGFNLGMNLGKAAGAGIAGHLHMHILPRWMGDVNFITTVAETRVIPEELETSYRRLRPHFLKPIQ